ncbi:MAG: aldo/keto reductase [Bryobacterales bacterium]|nr:aldo/keto reductase [Bryobacterales bacterium]
MLRRDFIRYSLGAGTSLGAVQRGLFGAPKGYSASPQQRFAYDVTTLGPDGLLPSRLAMGTGTSGFRGASNQTRKLGVRGITELYQYGFDNGITFWDTADGYGSHPHLRNALQHIPREKVVIMTKSTSTTAKGMRDDIERFRRELNTDYIDLLLLHAVREEDWPIRRRGAMDVINEYKQKGIVRSRGISCHSLPALRQVHKQEFVDVDLARINAVGEKMDADPGTVVEELCKIKAAGKGVIGMKILGEGVLRNRVSEALQHALALDCIDCFTIGAESRVELADLIRRIPEASTLGWHA